MPYTFRGDITSIHVGAIVNAASSDLILGGVAGAIVRNSEPTNQVECHTHGPVAVGEVAIAVVGRLSARYVIHRASMRLGGRTTAESQRKSTDAMSASAEANGIRTLAFPAIVTGIAGFDTRRYARITLGAVRCHAAAGDCHRRRALYPVRRLGSRGLLGRGRRGGSVPLT